MNSKDNRYMGLKPARIEALSDGVFAIVMTLLVIELSVPLVSKLKAAEELGGMLFEMWPKFFAFVISFLVLGIVWFTHHSQFHYAKRSNGTIASSLLPAFINVRATRRTRQVRRFDTAG